MEGIVAVRIVDIKVFILRTVIGSIIHEAFYCIISLGLDDAGSVVDETNKISCVSTPVSRKIKII